MFIVTTRDGTISTTLAADNASHALELMARSQGYNGFIHLCGDLNYERSDFEITEIRDERGDAADESGNRLFNRLAEQATVANAFKFLRRNG